MLEDKQKPNEQDQTEDVTFTLSDDEIRSTLDALHVEDTDTVTAVLDELSPADTADLIAKINPEDRTEIVSMYSQCLSKETFNEMDRSWFRPPISVAGYSAR